MYDIYDEAEVMAKINEVENTFHLVLIVEKFQVLNHLLYIINVQFF